MKITNFKVDVFRYEKQTVFHVQVCGLNSDGKQLIHHKQWVLESKDELQVPQLIVRFAADYTRIASQHPNLRELSDDFWPNPFPDEADYEWRLRNG